MQIDGLLNYQFFHSKKKFQVLNAFFLLFYSPVIISINSKNTKANSWKLLNVDFCNNIYIYHQNQQCLIHQYQSQQ